MSPHLFVLCMEFLCRMLRKLISTGGFSKHPKCSKQSLTHLSFADDLLIFSRGDVESVKLIGGCLDKFATMSGLHANKTQNEYLPG